MYLDVKSISSLRLVNRTMECKTNNAFKKIGFSELTISATVSALNSLYDAVMSIYGSNIRSITIAMSELERQIAAIYPMIYKIADTMGTKHQQIQLRININAVQRPLDYDHEHEFSILDHQLF